MSHQFYNVLHILGILMLFTGLAGLWGTRIAGGKPGRKVDVTLAVIHGVGLFFILLSGFGMLARLGLTSGLPPWIHVKLTIWLLMGAAIVLAKRKAQWGLPLLALWLTLGTLAGYFGITKPF